ncbi:MAG: DUF4386 family protein [Bacteroidota bacterium]
MTHIQLQKVGGISSILQALIYISAFIMYGGVLVYPSADANAVERLNFLSDNYLTLFILNLTSYVLFGILLAILVLAIHQRLKEYEMLFSKIATVFGLIWVGLVIASGMIGNIGLTQVIQMGVENPEQAMWVWTSISIVTEGLGGGNEIVGGIWVLLLSIMAWQHQLFPKTLTLIGILVGIVGIFTIYPLDIFKEIFGLSQIVWFIWIGLYIFRNPNRDRQLNVR